jgi:hypothetical protein
VTIDPDRLDRRATRLGETVCSIAADSREHHDRSFARDRAKDDQPIWMRRAPETNSPQRMKEICSRAIIANLELVLARLIPIALNVDGVMVGTPHA